MGAGGQAEPRWHYRRRGAADSSRRRDYNYREDIKYNDIGLVKLDSPVTFDAYVKPACLSVVPRFPNGHNAVEVTWGYDQKEESHNVMWKSRISMISHARCNGDESITKLLPTGIDDSSQLCGHYVAGDKFCTVSMKFQKIYCFFLEQNFLIA